MSIHRRHAEGTIGQVSIASSLARIAIDLLARNHHRPSSGKEHHIGYPNKTSQPIAVPAGAVLPLIGSEAISRINHPLLDTPNGHFNCLHAKQRSNTSHKTATIQWPNYAHWPMATNFRHARNTRHNHFLGLERNLMRYAFFM